MFQKSIATTDKDRYEYFDGLIEEYQKLPYYQGRQIFPPEMVDIATGTKGCNAKCRKCSGKDVKKTENLMNEGNYKIIFDNFLDYNLPYKNDTYYVKRIHLSSIFSDPLMDPIFPEYLKYIKMKEEKDNLFRESTVVTNGFGLTDPYIRESIIDFADVVSISINATNARRHSYIYDVGPDYYHEILKNISIMHEITKNRKTPLIIDVTQVIFHENFPNDLKDSYLSYEEYRKDMYDFLNALERIGVRRIFFRQDFFEEHYDLLEKHKIEIHRLQDEFIQKNKSLKIILKEEDEDKYHNIYDICVTGVLRPAIRNGLLYPCMHAPDDLYFGNLLEKPMGEIMKDKFGKGLESFRLPCKPKEVLSNGEVVTFANMCPSGNSFLNGQGVHLLKSVYGKRIKPGS